MNWKETHWMWCGNSRIETALYVFLHWAGTTSTHQIPSTMIKHFGVRCEILDTKIECAREPKHFSHCLKFCKKNIWKFEWQYFFLCLVPPHEIWASKCKLYGVKRIKYVYLWKSSEKNLQIIPLTGWYRTTSKVFVTFSHRIATFFSLFVFFWISIKKRWKKRCLIMRFIVFLEANEVPFMKCTELDVNRNNEAVSPIKSKIKDKKKQPKN